MRKLRTRRLALRITMISSGIGMMCSTGCFRRIGLSRLLGEDYIHVYGEGLIGYRALTYTNYIYQSNCGKNSTFNGVKGFPW